VGAARQASTDHSCAMLTTGDVAPDFTAPTDDGTSLTLSDLRGHTVVLFFYPKDDTAG
jgi:peroxiredoxin Q/BCP